MQHVETFWDFSVGTYRKPGVAEACLALQDRHGLDVNVLLFCCWYGCTRGPLDDSTFEHVLSFCEPWASRVVRPLRSARTWMKAAGCMQGGVSEDDCMALRDRIKKVEFEAEYLQQTTLEDLVSGAAVNHLETRSQLSSNALNLRRYINHFGITLDAGSRTELAHIVTAAIPGTDTDAVTDTLTTTFQET